jgi:hypothetical protein
LDFYVYTYDAIDDMVDGAMTQCVIRVSPSASLNSKKWEEYQYIGASETSILAFINAHLKEGDDITYTTLKDVRVINSSGTLEFIENSTDIVLTSTDDQVKDYDEIDYTGESPIISVNLTEIPVSPSNRDKYIIGYDNEFTITGTNAVAKSITVSVAPSTTMVAGDKIMIIGSATDSLNGRYTVVSVTDLVIVVSEDVTDGISDGIVLNVEDNDLAAIGPLAIILYDSGSETWNNLYPSYDVAPVGLTIFSSEDKTLYLYNGTRWIPICASWPSSDNNMLLGATDPPSWEGSSTIPYLNLETDTAPPTPAVEGMMVKIAGGSGDYATDGIYIYTDGAWEIFLTDGSLKMDKVSGATEDNIVIFDSAGNAQDSSIPITDVGAGMSLVASPTEDAIITQTSGGDSQDSGVTIAQLQSQMIINSLIFG